MMYLLHSWLTSWVVDPAIKHHQTTLCYNLLLPLLARASLRVFFLFCLVFWRRGSAPSSRHQWWNTKAMKLDARPPEAKKHTEARKKTGIAEERASLIFLINDLSISFSTGLLSCGSICQAPHHHTLCYNLLLPLLARLIRYLLN